MTAALSLVEQDPLLEDALAAWAPSLGEAKSGYRGHAYRVFNFARALLGSSRHDGELAVASAFHDIGIWSDGTFDYLAPSVARALEYVQAHAPDMRANVVAEAIDNHHRLRRIRNGSDPGLIEAFRQADLVDVSLGAFRGELDRGFVRSVRAAFPNEGFHAGLARTALGWFVRHPLRPLPMIRV